MYDKHLRNSKDNPACGEYFYYGSQTLTDDVVEVTCHKCRTIILQKKLASEFPNVCLAPVKGQRARYEVRIDGKHVGYINQYQGGRRPRYEITTFSVTNERGTEPICQNQGGRYRQVSTLNRWEALDWVTKNQDQMRTNDSFTKEREEFSASEKRRKEALQQEIKDDEMYLETLLEMKSTIPLSNIQAAALDKAINAFKNETGVRVRISEF